MSTAVRGYLTALNKGDGKRACRLLDERGKASLIAFLPSNKAAIDCEEAVGRVRRQIIPVRRFKVVKVSVSGRSATANVKATDPPYSSGVLLANRATGGRSPIHPGCGPGRPARRRLGSATGGARSTARERIGPLRERCARVRRR